MKNYHEAIELVQRLANDRALQLKYGIQGCLLCGHRNTTVFALYVPGPGNSKLVMQPKGKHRLIIYGLCARCFALDDKAELAEVKIHENYRGVN